MCRQNSHPSVIILISAFSHFSQTDRTKFLLLYKFIQSIIRIKLSILTRKNIVNLLRGSGLLLSGMTLEFPAFYNNLFSLCPNIVPLQVEDIQREYRKLLQCLEADEKSPRATVGADLHSIEESLREEKKRILRKASKVPHQLRPAHSKIYL